MATWQLSRAGTWDYPTLGFRASQGDHLIADSAPDVHWSSVPDGPAETVARYGVGTGDNPGYVAVPEGFVLAYNVDHRTYQPTSPAQLFATPPLQGALEQAAVEAVTPELVGQRLEERGLPASGAALTEKTEAIVAAAVSAGDTIVAFGTSIENFVSDETGNGNSGQYAPNGVGWLNHMQAHLGHPFKIIASRGVVGNGTWQMLARIQTDLLDLAPKWAAIGGPDNDTGVVSPSESIANLKAIYDQAQAAGIRVIARTAMPNSNRVGAQDLKDVAAINAWIRRYARARDFVVADAYTAMVDPATGAPRTGYVRDNIHPSWVGAAAVGRVAADAVRKRWGYFPTDLPTTNLDGNLIPNGMLLGEGTHPDGWSFYSEGGAAFEVTRVPRTDLPGLFWRQYAVTNKGTACRLYRNNIATVPPVGTRVRFVCEFETDANTAGDAGFEPGVGINGQPLANVSDVRHNSNYDPAVPATADSLPRRGIYMSNPVTIAEGATSFNATVNLPKGTVRLGRFGLYVVS